MSDRQTGDAAGHLPQGAAAPDALVQQNDPRPNGTEAAAGNGANGKTPLVRRPLFWIILIAVVATAIVGGILYWLNARQYESTDDAFIDAHIVRISPQIAGQLTYVADVDNAHVTAGTLLARIEPSGPAAQLEQAQAGIAQADAAIAEAQGRLTAANAGVRQALADARAPEANAAKAEADLARYNQLASIDRPAVAGQQLDAARAAARTAEAQAAAARQQVDSQRAQADVARKGIAAATAQRRAAVAQVAQAKVTYGDLTVTAPINGQVVNRSVNVGSTVSPQTQLMAIVPDVIWVTANFKETQLTHMRRGQPVSIRIDAFPGVKFHGHVDSIQRGAGQAFQVLPPQNASGNFVKVVQRVPVRILFDRNDGGADPARYPIGPGMSVVPTVKVR